MLCTRTVVLKGYCVETLAYFLTSLKTQMYAYARLLTADKVGRLLTANKVG